MKSRGFAHGGQYNARAAGTHHNEMLERALRDEAVPKTAAAERRESFTYTSDAA